MTLPAACAALCVAACTPSDPGPGSPATRPAGGAATRNVFQDPQPAAGGERAGSKPGLFRKAWDVDIDKPGGVAFDGKLLWMSDRVGGALHGFELATGRRVETMPAPGPWPTGLAFDGKLLWVADKTRERLFAVDLKDKRVVRDVPVSGACMGLAFDGNHLWLASGKHIQQIATDDGTTIISHPAPSWGGEGRPTEQLGLAFDGGSLWITDRNRDRIYRMEAESGMVIDTISAPGPMPAGLAVIDKVLHVVDVDHRRLYTLKLADLPAVERSEPRHEQMVYRRRIYNAGPDSLAEAHVYVAIPSRLDNQDIDGTPSFTPAPDEYLVDQWGQQVAHFIGKDIAAGRTFDVTMTTRAALWRVDYHIDPARVGTLRSIPPDVSGRFLSDGSKYMLEHEVIRRHTRAALGGETRPYHMVRKIARYIQDRMTYSLEGGWNVAPAVIERGTGSCSEYSFVFIAMCRAAGIPARYVGALVIRGDDASTDEVFHRWPEVYLPGYGWIPADAQAGDRPEPERQAEAFMHLENRFLITTVGGGGSEHLGWEYNSNTRWQCRGRCDVQDSHVGDWYPSPESAAPVATRP